MVAGREYSLKCDSWGSLPPAEISWYRRQAHSSKGIIPLNVGAANTDTVVSTDRNVTESWIRFTPSALHHRQIITCRATNYKLQGANNLLEDHRVLDIFCEYSLSLLSRLVQLRSQILYGMREGVYNRLQWPGLSPLNQYYLPCLVVSVL